MALPLFINNVITRSIPKLPDNVENQVCNAFKAHRGERITHPIRIPLENDQLCFIGNVRSVRWIGTATLVAECVILTDIAQKIGGDLVRMELDLRERSRSGELELLQHIR